jgi:hypothetical protein
MKRLAQVCIGWGCTFAAAWFVTRDAVASLKITGCEAVIMVGVILLVAVFAE